MTWGNAGKKFQIKIKSKKNKKKKYKKTKNIVEKK